MERDFELEKILLEGLRSFSVNVRVENEAYKLDVQHESKSVAVTWSYPLMEVFFDFSENQEVIKSESIEFYDGESVSELQEYVTHVIQNYINHSTRIKTLGRILKRHELQIDVDGKWVDVFD